MFRDGRLGGSGQQVLEALDIPPGAEIAAIRRLLLRGQRDGWWEYEKGCIGPAWQAAGPG